MAWGLLVELTHGLMRLIDGRSDTRTVAMFSFDGIGKPCIVGSQFEFQRPSAHGKPLLKQLDLSLLTIVQVELAVQYVLQFDAASHRLWQEMTAPKHARDGCDQGDNQDQNEKPTPHCVPPRNGGGNSGPDGAKRRASK